MQTENWFTECWSFSKCNSVFLNCCIWNNGVLFVGLFVFLSKALNKWCIDKLWLWTTYWCFLLFDSTICYVALIAHYLKVILEASCPSWLHFFLLTLYTVENKNQNIMAHYRELTAVLYFSFQIFFQFFEGSAICILLLIVIRGWTL